MVFLCLFVEESKKKFLVAFMESPSNYKKYLQKPSTQRAILGLKMRMPSVILENHTESRLDK